MQFSHARDDGFFALCVKVDSKCWVFSGETVNAFGEFVQVILQEGRYQQETSQVQFRQTLTGPPAKSKYLLPYWLA